MNDDQETEKLLRIDMSRIEDAEAREWLERILDPESFPKTVYIPIWDDDGGAMLPLHIVSLKHFVATFGA